MSAYKPKYVIGDIIYSTRHNGQVDEAAIIIGIEDVYETYRLLPLEVSVDNLTNEKMSFHVAHTYFKKV